jgi:plastocyanin
MSYSLRGAVCAMMLVLLTACGGEGDPSPTMPSPPEGEGGEVSGPAVTMGPGAEFRTDDAFDPNPITVPVGSTVTWVNGDSDTHDPRSDADGLFNTGQIQPGGQGSATFTTAGTVTYHCGNHPNMVGTIIVE